MALTPFLVGAEEAEMGAECWRRAGSRPEESGRRGWGRSTASGERRGGRVCPGTLAVHPSLSPSLMDGAGVPLLARSPWPWGLTVGFHVMGMAVLITTRETHDLRLPSSHVVRGMLGGTLERKSLSGPMSSRPAHLSSQPLLTRL